MTPSALFYVLGSATVWACIRLGGSADDPLFQGQVVGWLLLAFGAFRTLSQPAETDGHRAARKWSIGGQAGGMISILMAVAVAMGNLDLLDLSEEDRHQADVAVQAAIALLFIISSVPVLVVERVCQANPVKLPARRVSEAGFAGLSIAFAFCLLFPLNYLAHETNERWDHSYFKTAEPGELTRSTIENVSEPITAYLFFPHTSDVTEEIRTYFDPLAGSNLEIAYVDQALEAELAKELRVQSNGTIALVRGDGADQQVQRIRIGEDLDKAQRKLKSLDEEVSKALIKLASGQRIAYVTVGHGEMYWKKEKGVLPARTIDTLKKELQHLNFKVKELGPAQGLASEAPEDADLIVVMSPSDPLLPEEVAVLDAYRARGGALLVAMDPGSKADLGAFLEPLGLAYDGTQMLVGDTNIWVATRRITDRYNIFTNKASSHPSVTTLSRNASTRALLAPLAAPLQQLPNSLYKIDITMRTLPEVWVDSRANLRLDGGEEKRQTWPLAAAVSGAVDDGTDSENPGEFRVIVVGDATWASDLVMPMSKGNQEFLRDGIAWLVDEPAGGGTVNDEEDVKIRHTKKDEAWMFYGTTLVVPVALMLLGLMRVRSRRKRGSA